MPTVPVQAPSHGLSRCAFRRGLAGRGLSVLREGSLMGTLISSSEVAALAGVAPSTVSNWRKRHDDFPRPTETTDRGRDLFDLKEIERWLKRHRNLAED